MQDTTPYSHSTRQVVLDCHAWLIRLDTTDLKQVYVQLLRNVFLMCLWVLINDEPDCCAL